MQNSTRVNPSEKNWIISYLSVGFQNTLLNFIHESAPSYYSMRNKDAFSVEKKAWDWMLARCGIVYPSDGHDYILRMTNQDKLNTNLANPSFS